ncbi:hypothetical protein T05_5775 [Trichinella murrelli]|uniref:Uncharacterized protein n=1 Tax=Trichinella murrelli TaxID=144512 RepID=A0A0V0TFR4_9BILA|nr:hypothetical protein T05_5775 [Trichinella murrelli]
MCYRKLLRQRNNHLPHIRPYYRTPPPIFKSNSSYGSFTFLLLRCLEEELLARSASATVESSINSTRYCFILSSPSETNEVNQQLDNQIRLIPRVNNNTVH